MTLKVLDLFSGIGGFSLGLERTGGFETVAFCEIEEFPRRVLAKHWPGVPIYGDVRELTADTLRRDGIAIDVICGGFPCQDISFAGRRAGLEGARSGLWGEYARLIGELRPRFVIVENVPGLLSLGMGTVCGDLAALGYDAVWDCIPASAVGAPHRRDRVWIVAHARCGRVQSERDAGEFRGAAREAEGEGRERQRGRHAAGGRRQDAPHANGQGEHARPLHAEMGGTPESVADANGERQQIRLHDGRSHGGQGRAHERREAFEPDWWLTEPNVGRVAHGIPARVDRLKGLGNAVIPQIPELIGRAILAAEGLAP
jgi:DNA (cytosine-5)-methyltransferase 1